METEYLVVGVLAGVALAAGTIAALGYADPPLAGGAAAIGVGAGASCAIGLLASRAHWGPSTPRRRVPDPRVRLREAFRSGDLGRLAILEKIRALERAAGATGGATDPAAEQALLQKPGAAFLDWVEEHLAALEEGA